MSPMAPCVRVGACKYTEVVSKNVIFQKVSQKLKNKDFLENIASFSCRRCQAQAKQITILPLIMREEQEFLCEYLIF